MGGEDSTSSEVLMMEKRGESLSVTASNSSCLAAPSAMSASEAEEERLLLARTWPLGRSESTERVSEEGEEEEEEEEHDT